MAKADDDQIAARQMLEDRVEDELGRLKTTLSLAWRENPRFVQAFADRLMVENMTADVARPRRRVYQAIADYLEDAIEEREDADRERERKRDGRRSYIKRLLDGID